MLRTICFVLGVLLTTNVALAQDFYGFVGKKVTVQNGTEIVYVYGYKKKKAEAEIAKLCAGSCEWIEKFWDSGSTRDQNWAVVGKCGSEIVAKTDVTYEDAMAALFSGGGGNQNCKVIFYASANGSHTLQEGE